MQTATRGTLWYLALAAAALAAAGCAHPGARGDVARIPEPAPEAAGLSPEQVRLVQTNLRSFDIPVEVTGSWDAQTTAGLIEFQKRHGIPPTGRLDVDTRRELTLGPPPIADDAEPGSPGVTTRAPDEDRLRLSPPPHPDPQRDPAENLPEIPGSARGSGAEVATPTTRPNRQEYPGAFQSCVDRELSDRGLNAFGDPPGTPAREVEDRYDYVTRRYPDIGTACGVSPW